MEKLSDLLKVSSDLTMDISPGVELIQNFRKEFPTTAKLVLDMDSGHDEEVIKRGISADSLKQARILHEEMREFFPVIATMFQEIRKRVSSGKVDIKTDFLHSAIMRETLGILITLSFTMDWIYKNKEMTELKTPDTLSQTIIEMLSADNKKILATQSWIAVAYENLGSAEILTQLMFNEKFPPSSTGGSGSQTITK